MSLTKEKIIDDIYNNIGLSKTRSRTVVESLFRIIKETLESGENLLISGFGKFPNYRGSKIEGKKSGCLQDFRCSPK